MFQCRLFGLVGNIRVPLLQNDFVKENIIVFHFLNLCKNLCKFIFNTLIYVLNVIKKYLRSLLMSLAITLLFKILKINTSF